MEQESPIRTGPSVPKTDKKKKLNVKENMAGWLFATPWIIGLLIFFAFPLFSSIYFSFTNYSVLQPAEFVGLANYKALFQDDLFWVSIYNTVYFAVFFVPLSIIFGVALAMILNLRVKGMAVYRTIFFLADTCASRSHCRAVGMDAQPSIWPRKWVSRFNRNPRSTVLGSEAWSKPSLILMSLWGLGQAVIIYLAGLGDISTEYYEAAEVDGANWFQKTFKITLPLLTPVIFFLIL